jgi:hypothetical protein
MAAVVPLPAVVPPVSVSGAGSQLQPPMPLPASPDQPFFEGVAPVRQFSIAPRTNAGFEFNFGPQVGEEQALIVTGGVIMNFRNVEGASLIDIEADRVVIWTMWRCVPLRRLVPEVFRGKLVLFARTKFIMICVGILPLP